jgi:hypothetical protein
MLTIDPGFRISRLVQSQDGSTHYRAYAVRFDGNFDKCHSLNRADDDDAVGKAKRLADGRAIKLWCGERVVTCSRSGT